MEENARLKLELRNCQDNVLALLRFLKIIEPHLANDFYRERVKIYVKDLLKLERNP